MIIDFDKIEEVVNKNYYGGEKAMRARLHNDGVNKFGKLRLVPGASVGLHTHEGNCEIVYVLKGNGKVIYEGEESRLVEGLAHYCPEGKSHTIINDSDSDLELFAVIPKQ